MNDSSFIGANLKKRIFNSPREVIDFDNEIDAVSIQSTDMYDDKPWSDRSDTDRSVTVDLYARSNEGSPP